MGTREKREKQVDYSFGVKTSSGKAMGVRWEIACPKYRAPKEKQKSVNAQQMERRG
ncbi:MAG: hypothetical protein M1133_14055 [Armatimonadetes bacterium]|nr:hypothetical protein [Armatimonadota bacterium]